LANSRKLIVEVVGDTNKLERSLKNVEGRTQKFGRKLQDNVGGGLLGGVGKAGVIGGAIAAGSAVALVGLKKVVAAAQEAEIAQANLDQAFRASGVSSEKFGKQVDTMIQSVSKLSAFDDEDVSQNFAALLRTTGSLAKARRDVALAANIARARSISLAAATKLVEKAENGQLRGLKGVGVEIKKNMTATEAIDAAQRKFAGSAEAYGRTAAGAQDRLNVAFENLEERIGAKLLPVLTKLTLKLIDLFDRAEKDWPAFAKAVTNAYAKAKPAIDATVALVKGIANEIAGMVRIVKGIVNGDWSLVWKGVKQVALDGVLGVVKAVSLLPLKIAQALSRKAFAGLERVGKFIGDAIVRGFQGAVNRIIDLVNALIGKLKPIAGILGKVGIDVKVPQIGHVGGSSAPRVSRRPEEGTHAAVAVNLIMDGRQLNTRLAPYRQQAQARNPAQRRGPNAGLVSA
jgi:hypothetical protein